VIAEITQNTMGPAKLTTARPISRRIRAAIDAATRVTVESGQVGQHDDRRLSLAALIARATFLEDMGNSVPPDHDFGPSVGGRPRRPAGATRSDEGDGVAAKEGVQDHRRISVGHPAHRSRERGRVDDGVHQGPDVEGLLAFGVGLRREDLADRGEVDAFDMVRLCCKSRSTDHR